MDISTIQYILSSPQVLPFAGTPYRLVLAQNMGPKEPNAVETRLNWDVYHQDSGEEIGFLDIGASIYYAQVFIRDIRTQPDPDVGGPVTKNVGKDLVRRLALVAAHFGLSEIVTSPFKKGAASFWFGLGFLPREDRPCIDFGEGMVSPGAAYWRDRLKETPLGIWEMARDETGRRILHDFRGYGGILDLCNPVQRSYAASVMQIDEEPLNRCRRVLRPHFPCHPGDGGEKLSFE